PRFALARTGQVQVDFGMSSIAMLRAAGIPFVLACMTLLSPCPRAADAAGALSDPTANGDFTIGPEYRIDPDLTDRGNPKGRQFEFTMKLADSGIFRGDDPTLEPEKKPVRTERKVFVYVPAAYQDGSKAPVLVMLDGPSHLELVRNALDNLTLSRDPRRRLPAFVAVSVQNGGGDGKNSQRGLEYDTMSDRFARFIHGEVLPAVLQQPEIRA